MTIVYDFRRVLDELGIDNARSLVIDGETVFHDQRGEPGDLPNLILALSEHTAIFGSGGQELWLSVEHEEAGLRLVVEVMVASEHPRGAASARVSVLGEVVEFAAQHHVGVGRGTVDHRDVAGLLLELLGERADRGDPDA